MEFEERVMVHWVPEVPVQPLQALKLLAPAEEGAVRVTVVPGL